jgi:peptidoglycan hydrolase-like protein with peptidoglycan-binding domain
VVSLANVAPGKTNDDIKLMQSALAAEGGFMNPGPIDGIYGPRTEAAVHAWQFHLGFTGSDADGVIGRVSLTALGKLHGFRVSA